MKAINAYLGFIPAILVAVPCGVAAIRQALYYKGCMDGFEFVIFGFLAFVAGGILNVGFLGYVASSRRTYFHYAERRNSLVARVGTIVAASLLVTQLAVVSYFWWVKHTAP